MSLPAPGLHRNRLCRRNATAGEFAILRHPLSSTHPISTSRPSFTDVTSGLNPIR